MMIVKEMGRTFVIHARFDIPRVRAELRIHLINAQFSAAVFGRTVTAFTGLADALFTVNGDQPIEIELACKKHNQQRIELHGMVAGAASTLQVLNERTEHLQRIVDAFEILPENGYLQITAVLVEG